MKDLEYGKGYRYAHDDPAGVADMTCLPEAHQGRRFYEPVDRGFESTIRERLRELRRSRASRAGTSLPATEE
jgi:putative ATPase